MPTKTINRRKKVAQRPTYKKPLSAKAIKTMEQFWTAVERDRVDKTDTDYTNAWAEKLREAQEAVAPKRIGTTGGAARYTYAADKKVEIDPNGPEYLAYLERVAEVIATKAHEGQYRNDRKTSYISHPRTMVGRIKNPHVRIVAWLHDVVEDTDVTLKDLGKYFPAWVTDAVDAITKRDRKVETYKDYILRVKANVFARAVKIEDIKHNSETLDKTGDKYAKYQIALHLLQN